MGLMSSDSTPRLRVLVVDDEQGLTDLLRLELDVEGYDCLLYTSDAADEP